MRIITRTEWGARPPRKRHNIPTPTRDLIQHHTVGDYRGHTGIRAIQDFHMNERGWSDIAYSYIIDRRTLNVYEGRGAGVAGGHTQGHNTTSHGICVTGNFEAHQPSDQLIARIAELVAHGHQHGWWPAKITAGHRDTSATSCPGRYLYLAIPRINRLAAGQGETMEHQHVERLERAIAELGYTVDVDGQVGEREAAAVENMVEGVNNLIAVKDNQATVIELLRAENRALNHRVRAAGALVYEAAAALGIDPDDE